MMEAGARQGGEGKGVATDWCGKEPSGIAGYFHAQVVITFK